MDNSDTEIKNVTPITSVNTPPHEKEDDVIIITSDVEMEPVPVPVAESKHIDYVSPIPSKFINFGKN